MTLLRTGVSLLALGLLTSPALAAPDATTAAQLQQELKTITDLLAKDVSLVKLEGEPTVVADDTGYNVTLPAVRVSLDLGDYAKLPALMARLEPLADNNYRFTVSLPSPLVSVYDITDIPTYLVALQGQDINGTWDVGNQLVRNLKMDLRGLTLTQQAKDFVAVSLDRIKLDSVNMIDEQGKLNGTSLFTASALRGYDSKDNELFNLGGAAVSYKIAGADWTRIQKTRAAATSELQGNKVDAGTLANLASRMGGWGGKSAVAVVLSNISGRNVESTDGATEVMAGQLDQMRMLFSSAYSEDGQFNGDMHYHHDGLNLSGLPSAALGQVIPAQAGFVARVENVPLDRVLSNLESSGVPQSASNMGAVNNTETIMSTLDKAKARLVLQDFKLMAPLLTVTSSGAFTANEKARYGVTGNLINRIGKLDELIAALGKIAARPVTPSQLPDPMAPSLLMGLTMLRGFGNAVPGDSTGLREYKIDLDSTGSVNLNGTDIMSLIMGGAMAAGAAGQGGSAPVAPTP